MHRRRLRQRGRDGASGSESDADSELQFLGVKRDGPAAEAAAAAGPWECALCTFLNEDARARRCEMCDSARADANANAEAPPKKKTARMMSQWLAQPAKPKARPVKSQPTHSSDVEDEAFEVPPRSMASRRETNEGGRAIETPATQLWAEAYAPDSTSDLCVNKKKVEELRDWITRNATCNAAGRNLPLQRLLFLCGPPGAGKSTMVRCVARELRLSVAEWSDNESAGRVHYDRSLHSEFQTPYVSSLNDFADFIRQSVSYSALPLATAPRRGSQGRKAELTAEESSRRHRKRKFPGGIGGTVEAPPPTTSPGHLVLLESWPETWSREHKAASEEKLQQIFRQIVDPGARYCGFPVVCIFSDVRESKVAMDQLSRKFSSDVVRSPYTAVMNINPVTTAVLKKQLLRVVERERCRTSQGDIDAVVAAANGDIRHALNALQLVHNRVDAPLGTLANLSKPKSKKKKPGAASRTVGASSSDGGEASVIGRDAFMSDFRVLGKILYGKTLSGTAPDSQPVDYEAMISVSGMSIDKALAFVHENGVGYFSAIEDLAEAMELMSMTDTLVATSYSGSGNSEVFKRTHDIAQSILIRSIAVTNKNPERAGFRPITGPRMYATNQRMVSRRSDWLQRSSLEEASGLHHQYVCSADAFLFEVEPFLSIIEAVAPNRYGMGSHQTSKPVDLAQLSVELDDEIESSDGEAW